MEDLDLDQLIHAVSPKTPPTPGKLGGSLSVLAFRAESKRLYADVKPFGAASTSSYVLLDGVDNFAVSLDPMKSLQAARTGGQTSERPTVGA